MCASSLISVNPIAASMAKNQYDRDFLWKYFLNYKTADTCFLYKISVIYAL